MADDAVEHDVPTPRFGREEAEATHTAKRTITERNTIIWSRQHTSCQENVASHKISTRPVSTMLLTVTTMEQQERLSRVMCRRAECLAGILYSSFALPLGQILDAASTKILAEEDDDVLFDSADALSLDDKIMDCGWFQNVSWDTIKDLSGTTFVKSPARQICAMHQA